VFVFHLCNGFLSKQVVFQFFVKSLVATANPLQKHGCMFLLFVAIVSKNRFQPFICTGIDALIVPVNRFQLLDQRDDGYATVSGPIETGERGSCGGLDTSMG
jgi:hypothetical protein